MYIYFFSYVSLLKSINNDSYNNLLYYCTSISKISMCFKIIIIIYFLVQLSAQLLYPHLFGVFHLLVFVLLLFLL